MSRRDRPAASFVLPEFRQVGKDELEGAVLAPFPFHVDRVAENDAAAVIPLSGALALRVALPRGGRVYLRRGRGGGKNRGKRAVGAAAAALLIVQRVIWNARDAVHAGHAEKMPQLVAHGVVN